MVRGVLVTSCLPATAASSVLIAYWSSEYVGTASAYTSASGITSVQSGTFNTHTSYNVGYKILTASGSTGSFAATPSPTLTASDLYITGGLILK